MTVPGALRRRALAIAVLLAGSTGLTAADLYQLTVESGEARHLFRVELARSDAERGKGLMFRRSLDADQGMLFDFGGEQPVTMWMRNTYISLDMVFADEDGVIHRIAAHTEPFSEETIDAGAPTRYVLEVNAGTASRLGISPGDRMIIPDY